MSPLVGFPLPWKAQEEQPAVSCWSSRSALLSPRPTCAEQPQPPPRLHHRKGFRCDSCPAECTSKAFSKQLRVLNSSCFTEVTKVLRLNALPGGAGLRAGSCPQGRAFPLAQSRAGTQGMISWPHQTPKAAPVSMAQPQDSAQAEEKRFKSLSLRTAVGCDHMGTTPLFKALRLTSSSAFGATNHRIWSLLINTRGHFSREWHGPTEALVLPQICQKCLFSQENESSPPPKTCILGELDLALEYFARLHWQIPF